MAVAKPKSRIENLSTRFLKLYKYGVLILIIALVGFVFYGSYISYQESKRIERFLMPFVWLQFIYVWLIVNRKVYHVEFDDEFLYVIQKQQDILIPLENIKDVEIVSLGGVYKITLYAAHLPVYPLL